MAGGAAAAVAASRSDSLGVSGDGDDVVDNAAAVGVPTTAATMDVIMV